MAMIRLSATALTEVKRLQRKSLRLSNPDVLRIDIQSTGCKGLSYHLNFTAANAEDTIFECEDIQVAVNRTLLPYVDGLTLDYSEDLMGGSFRFANPNAKQTCSCGHSFALEAANS